MLNKFRALPFTVRAAIVFLIILVTAGVVLMPEIMIPLLIIFGGIGSVMRIMVYLVHKL